MPGNLKKYLQISVLIIGILLAAIGFGLVPVNLFFAKAAINEMVAENLGLSLDIEGPLRIRFGLTPELTASKITLRNLDAGDRPLVRISDFSVKPQLLPLLDGDLFLRSIQVAGVGVDYCQGIPPKQDATSGSSDDVAPLPSFAIDKLRVQEIELLCSDKERFLGFIPEHLDISASVPLNESIEVDVTGQGDQGEISLAVSSGSLAGLLKDPEDFPFKLQLQALDSEISLAGTIDTPLSEPEINARVDVISGRMESTTGNRAVSFNMVARGFTSRPYFKVDASFQQIDLQHMLDSMEDPEENKEPANFQGVFDLLGQFDAQANIRVAHLPNVPLPVDELVLEATLKNHVLELGKASGLVAGSPAEATAVFDMRNDCARLTGELAVSNFDLARISRFIGDESSLEGRLSEAVFGSNSCGETVQQHVESLWVSAAVTELSGSWDGELLPLRFDSLNTEISWKKSGQLSFEGNLLDEQMSLSAGFGSIDAIIKQERWPLDIDASSDGSHLTLSGEASVEEGGLDLDIDVTFDVLKFGSLHNWIGADPANDLELRARTALRFDQHGLALDDYRATLGTSDASGSLFWAGPQSDLPVQLDLQSGNLDLTELSSLFPEDLEIEKEADVPGYELLTQSEWLEKWFALPPADFNFFAKNIDGILYKARNVALNGRIRDRLIEDARLSLQLENLNIEGNLTADLQDRPWSIDFSTVLSSIDIGSVLTNFELADDVEAYAQRASIDIVSEGQTPKQLVENSRMDSTIENLHWEFEAGAENQRHEIDLAELKIAIQPEATTSWLANGVVDHSAFNVWMTTPSLPETFNPVTELPLTLVLGIGQDLLMVDAVVHRKPNARQRIDLSVSGEKAYAEGLDFSQLKSPLKDFHLRTEMSWKENELLFSEIHAQSGTSRAAGNIGIRYTQPIYVFDIDINAPFVETDDLVQWAQDWRRERHGSTPASLDGSEVEKTQAGILTLVDQTIDDFTGSNRFNVTMNIAELRSAGKLLGEAELGLKLDDKETLINPLRISSEASKAEASYHGRKVGSGIEHDIEIDIKGLEYGGLLRLLDSESEAGGELFLTSSLSAYSPDVQQAVGHLQGTCDVALFPKDARAEFLDLWASNLVFALLPATGDSGKVMNCMVARFEVENGVMKSQNTFLDSTDIIVRARGDIDLANRELDLWVAPQSKQEKFLSISTPIAVKGPFSDFKVGVAPGGFLTTMFRLYYGIFYVPWKWLTGERFPADGIATCYKAMEWGLEDKE